MDDLGAPTSFLTLPTVDAPEVAEIYERAWC